MFDNTNKNVHDNSFHNESLRLADELRSKPASFKINIQGKRIDTPARSGFDIETCSSNEIKNWLNDPSKKKSASLLMFVYRILVVRFPSLYATIKRDIDKRFKQELELIESESSNQVEWFGEVGFQNMVRLDKSLNKNYVKAVKINNDRIKFEKVKITKI